MATGQVIRCRATKDQDTVTDVTVEYLVTGLSNTTTSILADALAATNITAYGDSFQSNANVICKSLDVEIEDPETRTTAKVTAHYTTVGLEDGNYVFRFSGALNEDVTNSDAAGNLVTLSYTDASGVTTTQSPEIPVQLPELIATATGIETITSPASLLLSWIGYTNSDVWMGQPRGCWLCTNVPCEPHDLDASPSKYKITFEFQLKRKGWVQTVYFHDENGDVPSDIVYNVGYKRIVSQGYRSFSTKFPTT